MGRFSSAEADSYLHMGHDFAEYVISSQAEAKLRKQKIFRALRVAALAIPTCLGLGFLSRSPEAVRANEQAVRVITSPATKVKPFRNIVEKSVASIASTSTSTTSTTPAAAQEIIVQSPTYDADVAWVEALKQQLANSSVQTIEPPNVVEKDQTLLTVDGQCGALFTFSTSSNDPNNMNVKVVNFGPLDFFRDPDTLSNASQGWGVVGHEEGALMLGKDVPKADLGAAITTIVSDTPQLCNDLAVSLQNFPEKMTAARAALLDTPNQAQE